MLSLLNRAAKGRFPIALAAALGCALAAFPGAAVAQDDDDATFEQKILRGFLGGGQKNLEYRERSPLVIPPSRDLPPPESAASLQRSPAWPTDPDQRKRAAAAGGFSVPTKATAPVRACRRRTNYAAEPSAGRGRAADEPHVTLSDNEVLARPAALGTRWQKHHLVQYVREQGTPADREVHQRAGPHADDRTASRLSHPGADATVCAAKGHRLLVQASGSLVARHRRSEMRPLGPSLLPPACVFPRDCRSLPQTSSC